MKHTTRRIGALGPNGLTRTGRFAGIRGRAPRCRRPCSRIVQVVSNWRRCHEWLRQPACPGRMWQVISQSMSYDAPGRESRPPSGVGIEFALSRHNDQWFDTRSFNEKANPMPEMLLRDQTEFRVLRRQTLRSDGEYQIRQQRPSLLDARLRGDAWVEVQRGERLALCFAERRLAFLS